MATYVAAQVLIVAGVLREAGAAASHLHDAGCRPLQVSGRHPASSPWV